MRPYLVSVSFSGSVVKSLGTPSRRTAGPFAPTWSIGTSTSAVDQSTWTGQVMVGTWATGEWANQVASRSRRRTPWWPRPAWSRPRAGPGPSGGVARRRGEHVLLLEEVGGVVPPVDRGDVRGGGGQRERLGRQHEGHVPAGAPPPMTTWASSTNGSARAVCRSTMSGLAVRMSGLVSRARGVTTANPRRRWPTPRCRPSRTRPRSTAAASPSGRRGRPRQVQGRLALRVLPCGSR